MFTRSLFVANQLLASALVCMTWLTTCQIADAQTSNRTSRQQQLLQSGLAETTGLAKDNLNLVAASPVQIRQILVKDAGLLVELKRWVAKEATDSGQVLQPSNVTDDAIFDRLDRDIAFRSVATLLLQRYGYLLPVPNPDSNFAKEQDYILKERARRLVQVEAQEDNESLQHKDQESREIERTSECDPQHERGCGQPNGQNSRPASS